VASSEEEVAVRNGIVTSLPGWRDTRHAGILPIVFNTIKLAISLKHRYSRDSSF
jgi:hypothetical protein